MTIVNDTIQAGGGTRRRQRSKSGTRSVRVFHWSLVTLFVVAYATADEIEKVHIAAGYAIAGLVALRIVWGFVGPRHARFSSFVQSPRKTLAYLRDLALFRAPRHLGHNPAGGAMIVALLALCPAHASPGSC